MTLIQKSTVENFASVRELAIKIFKETFESQNRPEDFKIYMEDAFQADKIRAEYFESGSQYFEALENQQLVGYARVRENNEVNDYLGESHLEIQRVYVDSPWQGKGIAQQLMRACEEFAQEQKKEWIWLGVWEHNPKAIHFYRKLGYEKFSEHRFMLGNDEQTDWLMKKKLTN